MAKQIPTREPKQVTLGSSWAWDVTYADFPADESWQLSYKIRGPEDFDLDWSTHVTAGDGAEFEVRVTPAQQTTGSFDTPGSYRLIGRVNKSGDTWDGEIVYNEQLLVLVNPADAVNAKSFNRLMLEKIEAALKGGVANSAEARRISVNNRTIEYRDRRELDELRAKYAYLVAIEENPDGYIAHEVEFVG